LPIRLALVFYAKSRGYLGASLSVLVLCTSNFVIQYLSILFTKVWKQFFKNDYLCEFFDSLNFLWKTVPPLSWFPYFSRQYWQDIYCKNFWGFPQSAVDNLTVKLQCLCSHSIICTYMLWRISLKFTPNRSLMSKLYCGICLVIAHVCKDNNNLISTTQQ